MRTRCLTPPVLVATLALLCASAPAAAAPGHDAEASLIACHRAPLPAQRYLVVDGRMRAPGSGERMEMRFDLERRAQPGAPPVRVAGPGLGVYNHATAGVVQYRFRKKIRNLTAAGEYRVTITFRWRGPDGRLLHTLVRSTPACLQPEQRPDLRIAGIAMAPANGGQAVYSVTVWNAGGPTRGTFSVGLSIARGPALTTNGGSLRPGERRTVSFAAGRCEAGQPLVAIADPDRRVAERSETNNSGGRPCPGLPSGGG